MSPTALPRRWSVAVSFPDRRDAAYGTPAAHRRQKKHQVMTSAANLDAAYAAALAQPSDINELLPVLHKYAIRCSHITEFGMRFGVSTTCLLHARPARLVSYDLQRQPGVEERLIELAAGTGVSFDFHLADVRKIEIEMTDLLFIDTWHVYEQLQMELSCHAVHVRRYVAMHDTIAFGELGETTGHRGLWPAIIEFLYENPDWALVEQLIRNNGLTVLARRASNISVDWADGDALLGSSQSSGGE